MSSQDDEFEKWGRGVVSPEIVSFSEEAKEWIKRRAEQTPDDQICTLLWSLGQATYHRDGQLAKTYGPRLGFGSYMRTDVPEKFLTHLFGVDLYLRIDPHHGDRMLKSVRIWIEDGHLSAAFDPPAPERTNPVFASRIDGDTGRPLEGDT